MISACSVLSERPLIKELNTKNPSCHFTSIVIPAKTCYNIFMSTILALDIGTGFKSKIHNYLLLVGIPKSLVKQH